MVDQKEIILMAKLALHEKKYGRVDQKRNSYFKWDYIYINNWYTRLAVGLALGVIFGWMVFTDVYIKEIMPVFEVELGDYMSKYILIFALFILLYTGISTRIFHKKYEKSQARLDRYEKMLKELDQYQQLTKVSEEALQDAHE